MTPNEESGDLGDAQVQLLVQHAANYPIEGDKGSCAFTSDDTKWDECTNNYVTLDAIGVGIEVPFADFTGGTPEDTLNPAELVGVQWQFNCGDADCVLDVTLDNVAFY